MGGAGVTIGATVADGCAVENGDASGAGGGAMTGAADGSGDDVAAGVGATTGAVASGGGVAAAVATAFVLVKRGSDFCTVL